MEIETHVLFLAFTALPMAMEADTPQMVAASGEGGRERLLEA